MNFVFLLFDQFRAESAGCYGHPVVRTPNLDRLAAQGTRFNQCHVQAALCSPSRCSLMTGWYPQSHYYPQTRQYHEASQSISRTVMLRTMDWKFIHRPDEVSELYDLREDPRETRNLFDAPEAADIRRDLEQRMLDWLIRTSDTVLLNDDDRN